MARSWSVSIGGIVEIAPRSISKTPSRRSRACGHTPLSCRRTSTSARDARLSSQMIRPFRDEVER
ncbi:hypothetical protein F2981_28900 (plasmid) [Sinorhizobium meliloti]|nr:hypothetical protein [Sinorhizobium meliloti]